MSDNYNYPVTGMPDHDLKAFDRRNGAEVEVWQVRGGKIIKAPAGTFEAIWNDDEEEDDEW